ncbi:methionine--tRNA ligase, mitochondrial-like [Tubulanus polymorphus]|uniref:methionine--tRNA ligase, mitochondrial-like n=1 Tax=Tubulanus polymorphus TaxID=672921 RepID=UPI003DA38D21
MKLLSSRSLLSSSGRRCAGWFLSGRPTFNARPLDVKNNSTSDAVRNTDDVTFTKPSKSCFVTTPIFYVNAAPHIGHLYTTIIADAISRWNKLIGRKNSYFTTGTDEHGLKVQQAAEKNKMSPIHYCDKISSSYKRLFELMAIDYNDFIRTSEPRHKEAVAHFWNELNERGHIYKGEYKGWYSVADEMFYTDEQIESVTGENGESVKVAKETGHIVEWTVEDNYMFRLTSFKTQLLNWLEKKVIQPENFEVLVRKWVEEDLQDLSISRQSSRLHWSIGVPGDTTQSIYVWLDALVNYLTVAGYPNKDISHLWPADCQIVGKDILKFHAVYWPAFLMAAGLEPPRSILCHSHWMVENKKMSKSIGNVVDPFDRIRVYTADGLRYYLLRTGVPHSDGNYSDKKVVECLNSELCNTLGNLINRATANALNPEQIFPQFDEAVFVARSTPQDSKLLSGLIDLPHEVADQFAERHVYKAIDAIMSQLHATNAFIQYSEPWTLYKQPDDADNLKQIDNIVHVVLENLRVCSILLQPVVPRLAETLLDRLGIASDERSFEFALARDDKRRATVNINFSCSGTNAPAVETISDLVTRTCGRYSGRDLGLDTGLLFQRIKTSADQIR